MGRKPQPLQENLPLNPIYERVRQRLRALGLTETEAARRAGPNESLIRDIRRKSKKMPRLDTIITLASVLQTSPEWLAFGQGAAQVDEQELATLTVPVIGYVGEGASVHRYVATRLDRVPAPVKAGDQTVAIEVRGDSIGAWLDRALLFFDDTRPKPTADVIGRLCVVGLDDGQVVVRTLRRSRDGRYDLASPIPANPLIRGAPVAWAAPVIHIEPR